MKIIYNKHIFSVFYPLQFSECEQDILKKLKKIKFF